MASPLKNTVFFALLLVFLIVSASEMGVAEAKYCGKESERWSGPCLQDYKCSQHCKHWGAEYGVCKKHRWGKDWKYACMCYYKC